jgi:hypothetical protein
MLQKLIDLIDKEFEYKGKNIIITKVKFVGTTYVVFTNKQTFNFFENEVEDFVNSLGPIKQKNALIQVKKDELNPNKMEETEKNIVSTQENNLTVILLDTIEKVQKDKTYINQANAICNVVTQMINIKKLELQLASKTK